MRITKKYTGTSCLGKRVYHNDVCKVSPEVVARTKAELAELEAKFRDRLEQSSREKRESELAVPEFPAQAHLISTPNIDAMVHGGWMPYGVGPVPSPNMALAYPMHFMFGANQVGPHLTGGIGTRPSMGQGFTPAGPPPTGANPAAGSVDGVLSSASYPPFNHEAYMMGFGYPHAPGGLQMPYSGMYPGMNGTFAPPLSANAAGPLQTRPATSSSSSSSSKKAAADGAESDDSTSSVSRSATPSNGTSAVSSAEANVNKTDSPVVQDTDAGASTTDGADATGSDNGAGSGAGSDEASSDELPGATRPQRNTRGVSGGDDGVPANSTKVHTMSTSNLAAMNALNASHLAAYNAAMMSGAGMHLSLSGSTLLSPWTAGLAPGAPRPMFAGMGMAPGLSAQSLGMGMGMGMSAQQLAGMPLMYPAFAPPMSPPNTMQKKRKLGGGVNGSAQASPRGPAASESLLSLASSAALDNVGYDYANDSNGGRSPKSEASGKSGRTSRHASSDSQDDVEHRSARSSSESQVRTAANEQEEADAASSLLGFFNQMRKVSSESSLMI